VNVYIGREQTQAKHFILRRYLQGLAFKVLRGWDITYVDGFSGPWKSEMEDFADTSFKIAIEVLRDAQMRILAETGKGRKIRCFFSENDPPRAKSSSGFRYGNSSMRWDESRAARGRGRHLAIPCALSRVFFVRPAAARRPRTISRISPGAVQGPRLKPDHSGVIVSNSVNLFALKARSSCNPIPRNVPASV
jgi:hypothetical protein